jgi:ATP-dependent helicase/nuclease subunit A
VVGDRKQSIYSFQGANIDNFELYHKRFENKITSHGFEFKNLNLDTSFRTSYPVLTIVNEMLLNRKISDGITIESESETDFIHRVATKNIYKPGVVELWPVVQDKSEKKDFNYWNKDRVIYEELSSKSKLADMIAKKIKCLMSEENINPGDIMILLNRRTDSSILTSLVKKLTAEKIEIAGIDRLILTDNIIINDLVALAQISISDYDDLTLASVLKSPFFNFSEEQIFDICYDRKNKTVMEVLSEKYHDTYEYLQLIKSYALSGLTPFEFFSFILNHKNNLQACYCRAGMEISEIIQEFLSLCMSFEQTSEHALGLPGFISWITYDDLEIKRDIEKKSGKLRIMTVHSAKGLQSKIVFLPDTMSGFNTSTNDIKILFDETDVKKSTPYIKPPNIDETKNYSTLKDDFNRRQMEEKKRLLYVAMTRAEERLYICGYADKKLSEKGKFSLSDDVKNVYEMILKSFENIKNNGYEIEKITDEIFTGIDVIESDLSSDNDKKTIIRISKISDKNTVEISENIEEVSDSDAENFSLNFSDFIKANQELNTVNRQKNQLNKQIYSSDSTNFSLSYGLLVHKILEILPKSYQENDEKKLIIIIEKILATANFLSNNQKESLMQKIISALKNTEIKNIITSPNSVNEITISSRDNKQFRIDKLIVDDNKKTILIVDYKTDSDAEDTSQENFIAYKKQLKNYKKMIADIYKKYEVKTAILWTANFSISTLD